MTWRTKTFFMTYIKRMTSSKKNAKFTQSEFLEGFKILKSYQIKSDKANDTKTILAECNPIIRHTIMNVRKVFIGFSSCVCYDEISPTRCYRFIRYGHPAKFCRAPNQLCFFCASADHESDQCKKKNSNKCSACIASGKLDNLKHAINDKNCPRFIQALEAKLKKIN